MAIQDRLQIHCEKLIVSIEQAHDVREKILRLQMLIRLLFGIVKAHTLSTLFVGLLPSKWYLKRNSSGLTITSKGSSTKG